VEIEAVAAFWSWRTFRKDQMLDLIKGQYQQGLAIQMRSIIRFLAATLLAIMFAIATYVTIWDGPEIRHKLLRTSTISKCGEVHAGMTLTELERVAHSRNLPMDESVSENRFSFGDWESCQVELDPRTHDVIKAAMIQ
jgi:hypothetical protein